MQFAKLGNPDSFLTSGTGMTLIQECQCRMKQLSTGQMPMPDQLLSAFLHLHMICQHNKVSLTPTTAVYGRTGSFFPITAVMEGVYPSPAVWTCRVSFRHQQYGRAGCLSTTSSMDVQGVFLPLVVWTCRVSFHNQQYGRAGCLSAKSSMDAQGVFSLPAVWTCRVSFRHKQYGRTGCVSITSSRNMQGVFPPQALWTCRVSFYYQQQGPAGCLSITSSMNMQGVFPPQAEWTCRLSFHHKQFGRAGCLSITYKQYGCAGCLSNSITYKQYGRAGCLSTTNSMDVQGVFLLPAIRTCGVYAFQPASGQLCNRRKNNVDGGTSPVPE